MSAQKPIDIIITGDFCPQHRVETLSTSQQASKIYDDEILKVLTNKDLSITNLECPLTKGGKPIVKVGPNLKASPASIEALSVAKFDIATLANNHIMDQGDEGMRDTVETCHNAGIKTVGVGNTLAEAQRILYSKVNSQTIAIINAADQEFCVAEESSAGANPIDLPYLYSQISEAKKNADFVLLIVHGGNEHYHLPSPELKRTYRFFIDIGADAVVSHHTHFASGYEVYKGAPIFYSLGNFNFDKAIKKADNWYKGYFVKLSLLKGEVQAFTIYPYTQCIDEPIIKLMTGKLKEDYLKTIEEYNIIIKNDNKLKESWHQFTKANQLMYYSSIFQLNKIERFLLKKKLLKSVINEGKYLPRLLNLYRCQSHRSAVIDILNRNLNK
ncbi:CapA family protein [Porifericola rhodea]|uniref:CapA family protein n=1 Tax=Porifericola rhodea TaxID=930972 RepID=UPI002666633E|nr:CapA family protein [Porifericola rhodea]WKN30491.1 CapA family protein [Porifericola rhodea]